VNKLGEFYLTMRDNWN